MTSFAGAASSSVSISPDTLPEGIMAAKKKEMAWSAADSSFDNGRRTGAMYDIKEVLIPERKSRVEILTGSPEEAAAKLVEKLRKEAKVL